jgi:Uma2 family endonuclease
MGLIFIIAGSPVKMRQMAISPAPAKITFDEYLEQERAAKFKSEYRSGEVFAMAGGSPVHAELAMNIGFLLKNLGGCRVFSSDLKVYAQSCDEGMYPDVSVACEELQYRDARQDVILNPTLVVEVLSPSSRAYDLGLKASFYRSMPSVKAIFLVDSERVYVQTRNGGAWMLNEFTEKEQVVWSAGNYQFTVGEIYNDQLA